MNEPRYVAYFRVSTRRQGRSGIGPLMQQEAISRFLGERGGVLIAQISEIVSGYMQAGITLARRPQLRGALTLCREHRATLLVASLSRLARDFAFVTRLIEDKVPFICADMPDADVVMLQVYAAVAEEESRLISKRVKAGLAAARARGVELGRSLKLDGERRHREAIARAEKLCDIINTLHQEGYESTRAVARALNVRGVPTEKGAPWSSSTVWRMLQRLPGSSAKPGGSSHV